MKSYINEPTRCDMGSTGAAPLFKIVTYVQWDKLKLDGTGAIISTIFLGSSSTVSCEISWSRSYVSFSFSSAQSVACEVPWSLSS